MDKDVEQMAEEILEAIHDFFTGKADIVVSPGSEGFYMLSFHKKEETKS